MPTPYIDLVRDMHAEERNGVIRSLTRMATVVFDPGEIPTDTGILWDALQTAGIPLPFTFMTNVDGPMAGYKALVLAERGMKLEDGDNSIVHVSLHYAHVLDGPYQQLKNPPNGVLFGKYRTSVSQKQANAFHPNGDLTLPLYPIMTAHSFPKGDPDLANFNAFTVPHTYGVGFVSGAWPFTVVQGGEVPLPSPQANYHLEGYLRVADPNAYMDGIRVKMNATTWLGKPPGTWLCTEIQSEVLDPSQNPMLYRFAFEFQYDFDGWNPTVVFHDNRTGLAPFGVEKGFLPDPNNALLTTAYARNAYNTNPQPAGYWTVPALGSVDYNAFFGAVFEQPGPFAP